VTVTDSSSHGVSKIYRILTVITVVVIGVALLPALIAIVVGGAEAQSQLRGLRSSGISRGRDRRADGRGGGPVLVAVVPVH
jgi:hypothetical protein